MRPGTDARLSGVAAGFSILLVMQSVMIAPPPAAAMPVERTDATHERAPFASLTPIISWDWDEGVAEPVPAFPQINQPATTANARMNGPTGGAVTNSWWNDSTGTGWSMPRDGYAIPATAGQILRISVWGRPGDSFAPHNWSHRIRFYTGVY